MVAGYLTAEGVDHIFSAKIELVESARVLESGAS
jgi:hypothetical protein